MVLVACLYFHANAQLSPGKLTQAHSKLEGLANCTQCHDLGAKVSEQKCLNCHKELKARVNANKGFHVSKDVKGKDCITCHSEHHGVKFEMVRFDKKTFNHTLTGYELKGAHKISDCAKCHKADNITSPTLKKIKETFLGLDQKCLTCHDDYHQKTMSNDCATCHNFEKFKPALLFNHAKTEFPLAGAHKNVKCEACHKSEIKNGKEFQHFADVPHANCNACHKDAHGGHFGTNCKACHSEESFHKISGDGFNHSVTGYTLEGKHARLDCKKCHDNRIGTTGHYKEFAKIKPLECLSCHKDEHEGKFGTDCKTCHNQNTWKISNTKALNNFDHNNTDFKLLGKHVNVDCRTCHKADLTEPLAHDKCASCHKDYHNGDFASKVSLYPDCASCHTVDGYSPSQFTLEQHENSTFKLDGAHIATPCISCHFKNEKWVFSKLGNNCIDCHSDIHAGFIDQKYYVQNSCNTCHISDAWTVVKFDHNQTQFKLKGKHESTNCASCHIQREGKTMIQKFRDTSMKCVSCHENVHGTQFESEGTTDCAKCHAFDNWDPVNFNHDLTKFKLEGAHKDVKCVKCHKEEYVGGKKKTLYKIEKFECIDCHK